MLRKSGHSAIRLMEPEENRFWAAAYQAFVRKLESAVFGAVVLDYDGTLCGPEERYGEPCQDVCAELTRVLEGGIVVGIATGRGKSAGDALRRVVPKEHWERLLIGYYNGSDIACLGDAGRPDRTSPMHEALPAVLEALEAHQWLSSLVRLECRPAQITVAASPRIPWRQVKAIVADAVARSQRTGVQLMESDHSIDIVAPGVSKRHLVEACEKAAQELGNPGTAMCIGDKGKWPGNDYALLSTPYSLSVDTVSPDPDTCWNLAEPGHCGTQATVEYLRCVVLDHGAARFEVRKRARRSPCGTS
jgi:hypothetical protein